MAGDHRTARIGAEIREYLSELVVRGGIKDPRVQDAGLVTFTHVRVTGDLREATAYFMVHGADAQALKNVRKGLNSAAGFMRRGLMDRLHLRTTPSLTFEIDTVFEQEAKVDRLLDEIARENAAKAEAAPDPDTGSSDPKDE